MPNTYTLRHIYENNFAQARTENELMQAAMEHVQKHPTPSAIVYSLPNFSTDNITYTSQIDPKPDIPDEIYQEIAKRLAERIDKEIFQNMIRGAIHIPTAPSQPLAPYKPPLSQENTTLNIIWEVEDE